MAFVKKPLQEIIIFIRNLCINILVPTIFTGKSIITLLAVILLCVWVAMPPAMAAETAEIYVSAGMNIVEGLSVGLTGYYDIDAINAFSYATLSLSHGYDITKELSVELVASVVYAGDQFAKNAGGSDGGLYDYTAALSFRYACSDAWSVSAGVTYVNAVDDDNLKEKSDGGLLDTNSYVGVGISYAF